MGRVRWGDKEYPDSVVLGIGKNVPSIVFGVSSGLALAIGMYCVAQSNLFNILSGSSVNGFYVFGSLLVPYSWGLHVACFLRRRRGTGRRIRRLQKALACRWRCLRRSLKLCERASRIGVCVAVGLRGLLVVDGKR